MTPRRNWAGNQIYNANRVLAPSSVEEVQEIAASSRRLRVVGSGHSFNDLADTTGDHVSLAELPRTFVVDGDAGTVTVDGGARYREVCARLHAAGFAFANLASLAHISIAGACATATHGAGARLGNLATVVAAVDIVRADGEIESFARGTAGFDGAVVSLGALGVVTRLTLDIEPTFHVAQVVYEQMPFARALESFDAIQAAGYSVSLFTDWSEPGFHQVWLKRRSTSSAIDLPTRLFGARAATGQRHPVRGYPADACTDQGGVVGPWHGRLPHFRADHVPSTGDELQSEYLVGRPDAEAALQALAGIGPRLARVILVTEIRAVAKDTFWLSPMYGRDSVAFHFTWRRDPDAVSSVLPVVEHALRPFDPRAHWGKLFSLEASAVRAGYERRTDFVKLARRLDPDHNFGNAFVDRYVFGPRD
jgi:xylitol oxidase